MMKTKTFLNDVKKTVKKDVSTTRSQKMSSTIEGAAKVYVQESYHTIEFNRVI